MKEFQEFNQNVDKFTDIVAELYQRNLITNKEVELYNNIIKNIENIQKYLLNKTEDIKLSSEARKVWQEFETNRSVFFAKPYTKISRMKAIKKVLQLAHNDEKKFIEIVEWATALNYKDITPQILEYIKQTETDLTKKILFRESKYYDYNEFVYFFKGLKDFYNIDFRYYYNKVLSWSEAKGIKRKHWGFVAYLFIQNDINQDKLVFMSESDKRAETITGEKLKKIWDKITKQKPELKQLAEPEKFFRLTLFLKTTKNNYLQIEKQYKELQKILPSNIKLIRYIIKNK